MRDGKQERCFILQMLEEEKAKYTDGMPYANAIRNALERFGNLLRARDTEEASPKPKDPLAKTLADLVTPRQLVAAKAIANARGLNCESESVQLFGVELASLSRKAASYLIDHLKGMVNHND